MLITDGAAIILHPIGRIHTPFADSAGTPIQSAGANGAEGTVEVLDEYGAGLQDLAGFERIWLIYHFHRAVAPRLRVRPFLDTAERGVFSTRAPARPNHIGMSPVRLLGIDGNTLRVAGVDMLDGTPLLDIKPYIPAFDCFDAARTGWYGDKTASGIVADRRYQRE